MAPSSLFLSATVLFAQSTVAFNCSLKPIYVDIHKRAVHSSPVFQYGSFIGVGSGSDRTSGSGAQNHSLWPSLAQNHMSFASLSYCENSTLRECETSTGGFFDDEKSTTYVDTMRFKMTSLTQDSFQKNDKIESLDKLSNNTLRGFFGEDTLRLYTHYFEPDGASQTMVENSTIQVVEAGSIIPGRLGVGARSTVLQDLVSDNLIAGNTYSLYIGQGFDRAGGLVNGSNVFGGYDSGRFVGEPHKYPMNLTGINAMSVRIKDIVITDTKDATNTSLFSNQAFPDMKSSMAPFEAQITTEQFPLSLPYEITKNFIKHLNAEKDNTWDDNSLRLKNPFNGTLSIILDDGFTVTFPPEVLMNASNITPIQDREEPDKRPFLLGSAFLGQVYLMADYDSSHFYLAEAVQKNNMVMPVTFCPKSTPVAYQQPHQSEWQKQGLIGAVIGGVLGGIGCLGALCCLYVTCLRKQDERRLRRELARNQQTKMANISVEETLSFDGPPSHVQRSRLFFWRKI
jgi:hypothetical protein